MGLTTEPAVCPACHELVVVEWLDIVEWGTGVFLYRSATCPACRGPMRRGDGPSGAPAAPG